MAKKDDGHASDENTASKMKSMSSPFKGRSKSLAPVMKEVGKELAKRMRP